MTSEQTERSKPQPDNLYEMPTPSNGNSGNGIEKRLREVENSLCRLEEKVKNLSTTVATEADIESIKTLMAEKQVSSLRWAIGTSLVVAMAIVGGLRLL